MTNDVFGIYGHFLFYGLTLAFAGSALLLFVYFWSKGRLDMDESPKMQMLNDDSIESRHDKK